VIYTLPAPASGAGVHLKRAFGDHQVPLFEPCDKRSLALRTIKTGVHRLELHLQGIAFLMRPLRDLDVSRQIHQADAPTEDPDPRSEGDPAAGPERARSPGDHGVPQLDAVTPPIILNQGSFTR
jgi:hypothetical protein